ncbi:BR enhanced expression 1 [Hibiscus syriacus]|uniref:BR enhanced expression 1 n=1 Tax=Hibiscus syriacus TaxID=106335 RepID=A0A6A3C3A4_HIBSY|nr:BR enhanced expression 1 [Hibiscus syriacus]
MMYEGFGKLDDGFIAITGVRFGPVRRVKFSESPDRSVAAVDGRVREAAGVVALGYHNPRVSCWNHLDRWILPDPTDLNCGCLAFIDVAAIADDITVIAMGMNCGRKLEMAFASRTRNMLEALELERSPSAGNNWIPELSPLANIVVRRCSKILGTNSIELQESFNAEASDSIKQKSWYARNSLEYCSFRTLALSAQVMGHLADKKFRRLTFDMMVAWEAPAASSQSLINLDDDLSVGMEAFSRIAPVDPPSLPKAIKMMKSQSESSLLSAVRSSRGEKILEVDGTVTTQPFLEHVGTSTWPGRLILTDHALYFEALRVVSHDKPTIYVLSDDLKQTVKPELTGPWGTRLFDKAVLYKSISLSEPAITEFPELKGHTRRDYWLAIIREILYVHRFIISSTLLELKRTYDALSKAVLGILRVQAVQETSSSSSVRFDSREFDRSNNVATSGGMYSISALTTVSNLGFMFGSSPNNPSEAGLLVGELAVGEISLLKRDVNESRESYKKVVLAQKTVDGVKVDGIDTNVAVMKGMAGLYLCIGSTPYRDIYGDYEILQPRPAFDRNQGKSTSSYDHNGAAFGCSECNISIRTAYPGLKHCSSQVPRLAALDFPTGFTLFASEKLAAVLVFIALSLALVPGKYVVMAVFLETLTRYSPPRKVSTERWMRRPREWWFSIPAAPVVLETQSQREKEDKKRDGSAMWRFSILK